MLTQISKRAKENLFSLVFCSNTLLSNIESYHCTLIKVLGSSKTWVIPTILVTLIIQLVPEPMLKQTMTLRIC